mmetsp:Transcript_89126/g.236820  ORF Transcript_89126/g.236820 Transcript_89126/m.236820 type:complete len:566 (-) Transcript_89126:148-1845(-)
MNGSGFAGATGAPLNIAAIFGARSHYAVLGLAPTADAKEIRHAYRQVSLRIHPDKVQSYLGEGNPELLKDAEAAFKLVSAAYEILSDVGKRAAYDQKYGKVPQSRTKKGDQSNKPETWVYRAPKKEPEAPPEARETIELRITHAIYGHQVKLSVGKGIVASLVKKTLSKMVKRGPWDRIEFATTDGAPLDNDHEFTSQQSIFSAGLSLGPPRRVKVAVTDERTGVCRSIPLLDTSSILQAAREVAKVAGVAASEVGVGHFVLVNEDGLTEFRLLDEKELLNGRRALAVKGKSAGILELGPEEAAAIQDDLIVAYSKEGLQWRIDEMVARQSAADALGAADFHQAFGELIHDSRKDVIAKWGFAGDIGFVQMCRGIHKYEAIKEIHERSIHLGMLLRGMSREGTYLPQEMRASELSTMFWGGSGRPSAPPKANAGDEAPEGDSVVHTDPDNEQGESKQIWRIVGGQDKGGILAREELDLESPFCGERLSYGAYVKELALVRVEGVGDRLFFQRLTGSGPEKGWISVALPHKNLAERMWATEEEIARLAGHKQGLPGQSQPWRAVAG